MGVWVGFWWWDKWINGEKCGERFYFVGGSYRLIAASELAELQVLMMLIGLYTDKITVLLNDRVRYSVCSELEAWIIRETSLLATGDNHQRENQYAFWSFPGWKV